MASVLLNSGYLQVPTPLPRTTRALSSRLMPSQPARLTELSELHWGFRPESFPQAPDQTQNSEALGRLRWRPHVTFVFGLVYGFGILEFGVHVNALVRG